MHEACWIFFLSANLIENSYIYLLITSSDGRHKYKFNPLFAIVFLNQWCRRHIEQSRELEESYWRILHSILQACRTNNSDNNAPPATPRSGWTNEQPVRRIGGFWCPAIEHGVCLVISESSRFCGGLMLNIELGCVLFEIVDTPDGKH